MPCLERLDHVGPTVLTVAEDKSKRPGCSPEFLVMTRHRHLQKLCRSSPEVAHIAIEGLKSAVVECADQMRYERWDCAHPTLGHNYTILHHHPLLKYGYKETAFLIAISSAGVAYNVAKSCAAGQISTCKCDLTQHANQQNWEWGGCSYSVKFGLLQSRKVLAPLRDRRHAELSRKVQLHNMKAGRLAVKQTLAKACKCHGVSGSCQMKTCWKTTGKLSDIGQHLKRKLNAAKYLYYNNSPNDSRSSVQSIRSSELVFYEKSPLFCSADPQLRTSGTAGRICHVRNETHISVASVCERLCCGRGHEKFLETKTENCNCRFHWCCTVTCDKCSRTQVVHRCV